MNHLAAIGNTDLTPPGFGQKGAIEDCSIHVQGDPGTVTVTFSHGDQRTLLVLGPDYARILSDWLAWGAKKAVEG